MKFSAANLLATLFVLDRVTGKPYTRDATEGDDLGYQGELRHQQAAYATDDGPTAREDDGVEDEDEDEDLELQRATTYTRPVVPLQFRDAFKKRPKKKNVNKKKLLKKMGSDFDPDWMSLERPVFQRADPAANAQTDDLIRQVSGLAFDGLDAKGVAAFQKWLVKKASCPVDHAWTDLGEFFWPRYLKTGRCGVSGERGCSWPEGMTCVQAKSRVFHILRWHCRAKRHFNLRDLNASTPSTPSTAGKRRKCKWYKVPYPVTMTCKCSCTAA